MSRCVYPKKMFHSGSGSADDPELEPLGAHVAVERGDAGDGIDGACVRLVDPEERAGHAQRVVEEAELGAELVRIGLLGIHALVGGVDRVERLGGGVVGAAPGEVVRLRARGLHDERRAGRPELVVAAELRGHGAVGVEVRDVGVEVVEARAREELEPRQDLDVVDDVGADRRGVRLEPRAVRRREDAGGEGVRVGERCVRARRERDRLAVVRLVREVDAGDELVLEHPRVELEQGLGLVGDDRLALVTARAVPGHDDRPQRLPGA